MADERAVRTLLDLGADPCLNGRSVLHILFEGWEDAASCAQIAELLLQRGADCLLPFHLNDSLLVYHLWEAGGANRAPNEVALACLAHLERQRAAGELELGSADRAAQLLEAAALGNQRQLLAHGISSLEAHLAAAGGAAAAGQAHPLDSILHAAIYADSSCSPGSLQALLASKLPFQLGRSSPDRCSLLGDAAMVEHSPAAKVQLLHQAGVQVTAADLLHTIDSLRQPGLAGLLSVGRPAVDTSQPVQIANWQLGYSCPIHRALHALVRWPCWLASQRSRMQLTGCTARSWQALPVHLMPLLSRLCAGMDLHVCK